MEGAVSSYSALQNHTNQCLSQAERLCALFTKECKAYYASGDIVGLDNYRK